MRVLVCGSRSFNYPKLLTDALYPYDTAASLTIIEGGASGADRLASKWAKDRGREVITVLPNWAQHGKAAGPIRNQLMLEQYPDRVFAFVDKPLHESRGTSDMVQRALLAGLYVKVWTVSVDVAVLPEEGP